MLWQLPAVSFLLAALLGISGTIYVADGSYYRQLAVGERSHVPNPFAVRVLGPAIAGWLGRITGQGPEIGFLILGLVSLAALLVCLRALLRGQADAKISAAIFLMPFWIGIFHDYYLPDLLHAALLATILLCLARGKNLLAMALIFPAFLTRESTLLVAACLAIAAWRRLPRRAIAMGIAATAAGFMASQHFAGLGAANTRGLRGGAYMIGKIIWNLPRNLLGVPLWANSEPLCRPFWTTPVPHWWHVGPMQTVGICGPSLWGPARVLLAWAGIFGIGPAIMAVYRRSLFGRSALSTETGGLQGGAGVVFRFSVIYGSISLVLAPFLGASTDRLVEYAWPLFFVALPVAITAQPELLRGCGRLLLPAHLLTCWMTWNVFRQELPNSRVLAIGLFALALNTAAFYLLKTAPWPPRRAGAAVQ
ncbi:MAG TPA: hypothetical protein VHX11_12030 [Acidobacteriaceae bacterium]|jgi:hypothetical protein|nr:hypothetical protein [Acidobacteriaceae bacterium]